MEDTNAEHADRQAAGSKGTAQYRRLLSLRQTTKKLVDAESETNQRDRCPDPCHQRPFLRHKRAANGESHGGRHYRSIGSVIRYSASGQLRVLKMKFTGRLSPLLRSVPRAVYQDLTLGRRVSPSRSGPNPGPIPSRILPNHKTGQ